MTSKRYIVVVSLVFAVALLVTTYLLTDAGHAQKAMLTAIALWFISVSYLLRLKKRDSDRKKGA